MHVVLGNGYDLKSLFVACHVTDKGLRMKVNRYGLCNTQSSEYDTIMLLADSCI